MLSFSPYHLIASVEMTTNLDQLRFPVGKFVAPDIWTKEDLIRWMAEIAVLPGQIGMLMQRLSEEDLDTAYRPGGWTVRQVIHHLPDSHMNAYLRFKWTLTEEHPTIKPYDEELWAKLPDTAKTSPHVSLTLLDALHHRWVVLLKHMTEDDWQRTYYHPGSQKTYYLGQVCAMYAWHGRHHAAHIELVLNH